MVTTTRMHALIKGKVWHDLVPKGRRKNDDILKQLQHIIHLNLNFNCDRYCKLPCTYY